jgi:hypothetical protein
MIGAKEVPDLGDRWLDQSSAEERPIPGKAMGLLLQPRQGKDCPAAGRVGQPEDDFVRFIIPIHIHHTRDQACRATLRASK